MKKTLLLSIFGLGSIIGSFAQYASDAVVVQIVNTKNNSLEVVNGICTNPIMKCASDTIIVDDMGCSNIINHHGVSVDVLYSENFIGNTSYAPGSSQYDNWIGFTNSLTGYYTQVTIKGSLDLVGVTCTNDSIVNLLAAHLNAGTETSILWNGRYWSVKEGCGGVGNMEFNSELAIRDCSCSGDHTVRPAIGNQNWGGIGSLTCNAPTQTMEVLFKGVSPYVLNDSCDVDTVELMNGVAFGDTLNQGTNNIVYHVKDSVGGFEECSYKIHVLSKSKVICPGNITKSGAQVVNYNVPVSVTGCTTNTYVLLNGNESGSNFTIGTHPISYVYADSLGNLDTCNFQITINTPSGLSSDIFNQFKVYPNPSSNVLFIDKKMIENVTIKIVDLQGRTVISKLLNENSNSIDLTQIERGVYIVNINSNVGVYNKKIIVE